MSTQSNTFSQGGGGPTFEINVQTAYFISFLLGGQVPGLPSSHITNFRQQSGSLGYETDDILLHCEDELAQRRLLMQVKHQITISAENALFREVLTAAWKDFNNPTLFNADKDRIYLISAGLPIKVKNHLVPILSWAKAKSSPADYLNEVNRIATKKDYYDIFKTIITATSPSVTDDDLFRFFKCFEVLDYDLDQEASVTKANVLTSLTLAKDTEETAASIWNEVFVLLADSNSKGGEYTLAGRPAATMAKLKSAYLSSIQKSLLRLSARSQDLLDVISDKIGSFHLNRAGLAAEAALNLSPAQTLIITGEAGSGKSALAKTLLAGLQTRATGFVLAFKADELLTGQLRDWFDHRHIDQDIHEVFSHFALLPNAVIYVDSMERLLEEEALPFKELLLTLQRHLSIKLIGTCRKSLLNIINLKFFSSFGYAELEIPYLTDAELREVCREVPALTPVVENTELQELVRIPKYLDFAYRTIQTAGGDYSKISEVEFQNMLWKAIVENLLDGAHHGLPMRRSESFIDIAVVRSRKMQAYVPPTHPDPEALEALQKETVLLQYQLLPLYAPAHDVLEDWALVRHTNTLFAKNEGAAAFFTTLGTEPAMRRTYRLWVQQALKEQDKKKIAFFTQNLTDTTLDHFWHIESLIAVLSSPHCEAFLQSNLALLKRDDWALLFRIVQIMRTASRVNGSYLGEKVLVPSGNGWAAIFRILAEDSASIPQKNHPVLLATLREWKMAVFTNPHLPAGTREAGLLTQFLVNDFLAGKGPVRKKEKELQELVHLLFAFAGGVPTEMKAEFDRAPALAHLDDKDDANDRSILYGETLLDLALKGPETEQLARYLPEVVMDLARDQWYRKPRPKLEEREEMLAQMTERSEMDNNFRFGLASDLHMRGTESSLSTPVYWLLKYHTDRALDFIIALLNHATSHYRSYGPENDLLIDIPIELPDGTTNTQTGSVVLWTMFRGQTGYGTPLLNSVLMALEKYLLEVGAADEARGDRFRHLLAILMTKSETVATTAVVASAVMAYPLLAGEWVLPLVAQKAFYSWDISRYQEDFGSLFLFQDGSLDVKERTASHSLLHRTRFFGGLRGFVNYYWIMVGTYNRQIAEMIDRLSAAIDPADLDWKKTLEDIDGRRLVAGKRVEHEGKPGFEVQTQYSPEVQNMTDQFKVQQDKEHAQMMQVNRLKQAYAGKEGLAFEDWAEIYAQYKNLNQFTILRHAPGLLASLGIRDYWAKLSGEQKKWCFEVIEELAMSFVLDGLAAHRLGSMDVNMYDTPAVMETLPRMLSNPEIAANDEQRSSIEEIIFFSLVIYHEDNNLDYKKFVKSLHLHFWLNQPDLALKMWYGALALGLRDGGLPSRRGFQSDEAYVEAVTSFLEDFLQKVRAGEYTVDIKTIDFSKYFPWVLVRAINLIPGYDPPIATHHFIAKATVTYLWKQLASTKRREDNFHQLKYPVQSKVARIFLESALGNGATLMDFFCKLLVSEPMVEAMKQNPSNTDLFFFFYDTLKQTIIEADQALTKDPANNQRVTELFQAAWGTLDKISQEIDRAVYWPLLLLDIKWDETARHWQPIEGIKPLLVKYLDKGTDLFPGSAINLLASVGDQTMLPEALLPLVNQLKNLEKVRPVMLYKQTKAEQLAHRLHDFHLKQIREDPKLMTAYHWLLDKLIDEGSTDAYWLKEFVISYHRQHTTG